MIRIVLRRYGAVATNLKVARRLAGYIRGAQLHGRTVLIDCEDTEPTQEFLDVLLKHARTDKVKFCGLPIMRQVEMALRLEEKEGA